MEPPRIRQTTHSTRTPRSAPFVRTSATTTRVAGRLTNRGSTAMDQADSIQPYTGRNTSANATR